MGCGFLCSLLLIYSLELRGAQFHAPPAVVTAVDVPPCLVNYTEISHDLVGACSRGGQSHLTCFVLGHGMGDFFFSCYILLRLKTYHLAARDGFQCDGTSHKSEDNIAFYEKVKQLLEMAGNLIPEAQEEFRH